MARFHPRLLSIASLLLGLLLSASSASSQNRINVLLVTSDDLGLQLGCYGDPVAVTPHLDALAADSTRFNVAYVAQASCSPSRSAMFTGLYPHTNGQYALTNSGYSLHRQFRDATLPNRLAQEGYRTGIIGKLHVAPESSFHWSFRGKANTRDVASVANTAAEFIGASSQPFFLMINYSDPHWERNQGKGPWFFQDQVEGQPVTVLTGKDVRPFPFQGYRAPQHLDRIAGYYNAVHRLDAGIGMLMAKLKSSGHSEDTLVLFLGDHGPPFARGKTTCYEAGLRVPFFVRWPGVSKPIVSDAMVSSVDIVPTVLDAVGAPLPTPMHGHSLRKPVAGDTSDWRPYLAAEFHSHGLTPFFPRRAIRDDRYKLIHNLLPGNPLQIRMDGDPGMDEPRDPKYIESEFERAYQNWAAPPQWELFDLESDPWELHNVAGEPSMAAVRTRLTAALAEWESETADPLRDPRFVEEMAARAKAGPASKK
ncbi:sulfatase family protein [Novipirellula artificiosorum]|uniref:Arylsulfatase n=1 Tax=Novipirellula artificiosorum TaxID=2528016 RepID=A0A5C6DU48_9BACT|nr:sulfatase [Novipirellula artificiosorum]TWU40893.1 Arylsulfatase [Novipirellula artificiosorum]